MKHLHPYLYGIIHNIVQQRIEDKKFPYVAMATDVFATVKADIFASLEEMEQECLVSCNHNINGIALYRPLKSKEDENDNV